MRTSARVLAALSAAIAAGIFAGSAYGAYNPRLSVEMQGEQTQITISQLGDEPTSRVVIYAPPGYTANLAQPPRSQIGSVRGRINILDLAPSGGGVNQEFTGGIATVDPAEAPPTAALCAPGRHDAIWLVTPSAAGTSLEPIPVLVDVLTSGPEAAFGSLRIQVCFRPPDVPQGSPGRAPGGARPLEATFTLLGVIRPSARPNNARWTAVFTPYARGTGRPDIAGTAQAQSVVRSDTQLTLQARVVSRGKRKFARLTGRLEDVAGARVQLLAGSRSLGFVTTRAGGAFSKTVRITRTTTFRARATVRQSDATASGCTPAVPLPGGGTARCASVTLGGFTATSRTVRVTVRTARGGRR